MEMIIRYVTLVIHYEDGNIEYHTLSPYSAAMYLMELPYEEKFPRPIKAKIIWGNILDSYTY